MVFHCLHLRVVGELEDEASENGLSASRASCSSAARSDESDSTILHWQIALDVLYRIGLQMAMFRRGHGVKDAAMRADTIKLFPATARSVWQDALYNS